MSNQNYSQPSFDDKNNLSEHNGTPSTIDANLSNGVIATLNDLVSALKGIETRLDKLVTQKEKANTQMEEVTSQMKETSFQVRDTSEHVRKTGRYIESLGNKLQNPKETDPSTCSIFVKQFVILQKIYDMMSTEIMNALKIKVPSDSNDGNEEVNKTLIEVVFEICNKFHNQNESQFPDLYTVVHDVLDTNKDIKDIVEAILRETGAITKEAHQKKLIDQSLREVKNVKTKEDLKDTLEMLFNKMKIIEGDQYLKGSVRLLLDEVEKVTDGTSLEIAIKNSITAIKNIRKAIIVANHKRQLSYKDNSWLKLESYSPFKFQMPVLYVGFGMTLLIMFWGHLNTNKDDCTNIYSILTCFMNVTKCIKEEGLRKDIEGDSDKALQDVYSEDNEISDFDNSDSV